MHTRFARYAWLVLAVNVLVILWGAVVRATGAGAGCGEHWPLCNGEVVPQAPQVKTMIEFGHRTTSGLALIFVAVLVVWAWRAFPKGSSVRRAAAWALGFELAEGLIGAGLVLLGHVAANQSVARGYSLGLHLINTLLLLAALSLTAWFATPRAEGERPRVGVRKLRWYFVAAAAGVFLIGISGAIAALGDTLFRSATLAEGMRQDFDPSSHPFVRLRIWHPTIAAVLATYMFGLAVYIFTSVKFGAAAKRLGGMLMAIVVAQVTLGVANLILRAPVAAQIGHLLLADLLWITFVLLSAQVLVPGRYDEVCPTPPPAPKPDSIISPARS